MGSRANSPRFPWHLLVVFTLLAAGIVAVGYIYYHGYEQHHCTEVERQLLAIAELKTDELVDWRRDRMGDAAVFFKNAAFSALVRRHFGKPDDAEAQSQLRSWLGQFQAGLSYGRVFLLDARDVVRMQVPDTPEPLAPHLPRDAAETLRSGKITFLDFHRGAPDGPIHLTILVPILDEEDGNRPLGVLAIQIDPAAYLYPFISRWPTPSPTAETLLVRRDGDDALFLNELRFQKNTALVLHAPLTRKEQPAVMAALGQEGIVEGTDYRGVAVVAAVRAVPDSPWFLVARMDASEVHAPARERLWIVIVLVGALLLGAGAALGAAWRHQSVLFYKEKFHAAAALRESEEKYRILFQTMAQGVVYQSADGKIISANPAAERILGLTLDEMQGLTSIDPRWRATHEDGSDFPGQTHPAMVALQTGREVRDVVMGVYNPRTKSHVWISINAVPKIEPGDDKPCQVYATFDDITDRKRAEAARQESEKLYRSLFENMLNGFAYCRMLFEDGKPQDFIYLAVNDAFESQTGLANVVGRKATEVIPGIREADPQILEIYGRVAGTGRPERFEMFVEAMQMWFWISVYSPVPEHFVAVFDVITDRKRAEEQLRTLAARNEAILAAVPAIVVQTDRDKVLTWLNEAGIQFYGPDALGREASDFFVGAQDTYEKVQPLFDGSENVICLESWQRRKDGRKRLLSWWCRTLKDGSGNVLGAVSTAQDITDRQQAEEATRKAQAELLDERQHEKEHAEAELARMRDWLVRATRLAAIGQVSASIAHDLRNPLGTVRNAAYYLERRLPKDQPEVAEYMGIINQEVAAADRIITNLLAVARAKEPVKQHVDLGQTILEALAGTGQAEAVRLRMSLAPDPFMVRADPDQLRQVFRNLVTNAAEALSNGGEIVVEAARDADGDSIVLRDTGPGVTQEVRESLFEPLVTTKARGIGLGLTICRQIIEHHGGSIELIDEGKPGAAFRIRLPRQ